MRFLLVAAVVASAAAASPLVPEYEVQFSDVSHVKRALDDNAWAKEFQQSNLWRGAMVKLGPVLFAVGTQNDDSWKGRLVDFLYDKVLEKKRLEVSYFQRSGLVSPFGVTVFQLSTAEKTVLSLILKAQKLGDPIDAEVEVRESQKVKVKVHPVAIRLQKFAVAVGETCFAVSRDPSIAAMLGHRCPKAPQKKGDVVVTVDVPQFFPAWYPVLERLVGVGKRAEMAFDYDKKLAAFVPARAEMALKPGHLVGTGKLVPEWLGVFPSDSLFWMTAFLPDPGPLSPTSVGQYFKTRGKGRAPIPVGLVYLGMRSGLNDRPEAMSAIVVQQDKLDEPALAKVNELFDEKNRFEVKYAKDCGKFLVLSPSQAALNRISDACQKKAPSFAQMPQFMVDAFTKEPVASGVALNLGGFLKASLDYGWDRNNPPASNGTPVSVPREIAQTRELVGRLPLYAFAGKVQKDTLVLNGVKP